MASLLVVGADHLGNITDKLVNSGFREIIHVNGRKVNMVKRDIPEHVDAVLVMIDYINHNLAKKVKEKAKSKDKPIYFVKRSWSSIYTVLEQLEKHA
ncbi:MULTISPECIES: DUF2325 domain-containing protein [Geobacillus]|jgi:hypothetical protein|uniref:Predicted diverged CheY-domain n=2 Tax=Geobacillus thermodenitrificans TaxID=33940 RepID=A4IS08_GEOTN|nr:MULTISPECIES: DUF2325 domain-containing protein [Geobacillus]ABO68112.1 Predicted diverged CheY-domain [Geobacillus thermodenitrificans NG80-2]ARA98735.1 dihydroorotate dehydrogenase [Geobacillus thermodenitrificans]ARP43875.1 hypothetical protein GTHT12_02355 [Geobacillus thermodenitrificans]ATO38089.1 dihydroorotate dehydrogenase [Geobacillus thermodenitrificans]KQB92185.1 dihydroorotate dehydrogenase [Geobacillus sp. PA-3]